MNSADVKRNMRGRRGYMCIAAEDLRDRYTPIRHFTRRYPSEKVVQRNVCVVQRLLYILPSYWTILNSKLVTLCVFADLDARIIIKRSKL
jgi:hypothetical protein